MTNRLEVVSAVGVNIDSSSNSIGVVELTVRKAPGAGNIDLGSTTVQMVHSSGSYDLIEGTNTGPTLAPNSTTYSVSDIQDDDTSITTSQVLNDPSDRAVITLDVDDVIGNEDNEEDDTNNGGNGLVEGDTATIRINTQSGGTTELRLVVPETLSSDSAVTL